MARKKNRSLDSLIELLGVDFKDRSLLDKALLHKSYSSQHQIAKDNERLEFLGDSILSACVSDILYKRYPEKSEGELTKLRSMIVSGRALKKWGKSLGLEKYVFLSEKMKKYMAERETHIIENTMESIIGAMYLDSGFKTVYKFIRGSIDDVDISEIFDYKSLLQEFTVSVYSQIPKYEIASETGPAHNKKFKVTVSVNAKVYGEGSGTNKKMAQQNAAKKAYKKLMTKNKEKKNE